MRAIRFRTIRQRRRRARSAQVSAVATLLTLLMVVSYIANYLGTTLPSQMSSAEFDHLLKVENQLTELRAAIFAEANHSRVPLNVPSAITLGSDAVPPFGAPATGTLSPEASGVGQAVNYQLDQVTPVTPNWGIFSPCLPGGSGHCAGNGNVNYGNFSGNNTTLTVTVTGGGNSLVYNINGDNDTITINWNGKDMGVVAIVVNGSYDSVSMSKGGSDTTVPTLSFYFFGIHDTYSMSMAGSHSSHGGVLINVYFIGSLAFQCPSDNRSATDSVGTLGAGGSNLNLSVTWWNAVGYVTSPNIVAYPGGSLPSESVSWQNVTGFAACPFLQISSATYTSSFFGGLNVNLANHYEPTDDVGFEDGAVLVSNPGVPAFMVNPPNFYFNETSTGLQATLTLIALSGAFGSEAGVGTAVVSTHVSSVSHAVFGTGVNSIYLATPYYLNITTQFPAAWANYLESFESAFPYDVTCKVLGAPLTTGYTCLTPPEGRSMMIIAPLYAQTVSVTTIRVAVQLT